MSGHQALSLAVMGVVECLIKNFIETLTGMPLWVECCPIAGLIPH